MDPTTTLICPKCQAEMRSYERNGIVVDQCTGCRGIFLDRGELERLLDVESGAPRADDDHERSEEERAHGGPADEHGKRRRRPSSFLEDLLGG